MNQKYLLITSDDNDNIGVIRCDAEGQIDTSKLERLLSDEYGDDIQVNSLESLSITPLRLVAKCSDVDMDMFSIQLNETWVY